MNKILKNMIFAAMIVSAAACSLKEEPTSFVNKHNFYKTPLQCQASLNRCYAHLNNIFVANFMIAIEGCTDLWNSQSSSGDSSFEVSPSKPQVGAVIWEKGYQGVMDCNEAIACIETAPIDENLKRPLVAEGRVLRAMYYYILTSMFGGVPYYTCMVDSYQVQDSIRVLERTPADTIRTRLYNDLRDNAIPYFTKENGLKVRGGDAKNNRSGYAHGLMLMAKFAMWNACSQDKDAPKDPAYTREWFEKALVPLDSLENLYGDFTESRYPLEKTQWRYKNTAESIFEIQHAYSKDGVQYFRDVAAIMQPMHEEGTRYDGAELKKNYGNYRWDGLKTNDYYLQCFSPLPVTADNKLDAEAWKKGQNAAGTKFDKRIEYVLGLGNFETGSTFTSYTNDKDCWAGSKFWCPDMERNYDFNNYRIFRYADAVLMKAEALANLGDWTCKKYLLKVRERAGVAERTPEFTDFSKFLEYIRAERARELGGEFMRKFDLVRWGIWHDSVIEHWDKLEKMTNEPLPCYRYYPIPDTQCALSRYKLRNPEYEND